MSWELICIDGDSVPQRLHLDESIDLGRDPHCDVRLLDDRASRFHARIEATPQGPRVRDNSSANGSFLDGERVEEARLRDGQQLMLGNVVFSVVDTAAASGATRVVTDTGATLAVHEQRATRIWRSGDDAEQLAAAHRCLQAVHAAGPAGAPRALARAVARELRCSAAAVVLRGRATCIDMDPQVAQRLAGGAQARLLRLGRDLVGQTIARAAIGGALSAPLGANGHVVAARRAEEEPPGAQELALIAAIAAEVGNLAERSDQDDQQFPELIGDTPEMHKLRSRIRRIAATDATVLVAGESGTGKELVARALHHASGRAAGPFIAVNCAAIAAELFEAELFGHEKGAYTGAEKARPGRFRAADGGTLFLDEIGELPEAMQAKLLRVLQENAVEPVGGDGPVAVDVRVLTATNRDLQQAVSAGTFRSDLFYRLDVIRIDTPPLRNRREDIPLLATHLIERAAREVGVSPLPLAPGATQALISHDWPGNVRQLANTLTRALVAAEGDTVQSSDLDLRPVGTTAMTASPDPDAPFPTLAEMEAAHVRAALARTGGNKTQAAKILGVSRPTVLKKIADYGID